MRFVDRIKHGWNAFSNRDPTFYPFQGSVGAETSQRPDRVRVQLSNDKTIVASIWTRLALDAASLEYRHIKVDVNGRYQETIDSGLNECLSIEANIDQTSRAFMQDVFMSMFIEGALAIVPVDTSFDPSISGRYDIHSLRTGKIVGWRPEHVRVNLYNDRTGHHQELWLPKKSVAIIENPFYAIVNEPNSTMQRLIRKLNLLDVVDEQSSSGKLDIIIQLPFAVKTESQKIQAETRRKALETQLSGSKYGIAYADATERITQLNRSVENNLMKQIEYLTSMLFGQLGLTPEILNGSASEEVMLNYYNRTVEVIASTAVDAMRRTFLTKTARSQNQTVAFFRDPFRLVPVSKLADLADKFTRNEIMTSNEFRGVIRMKPSADPNADQLRNKNLSKPSGAIGAEPKTLPVPLEAASQEKKQNGEG